MFLQEVIQTNILFEIGAIIIISTVFGYLLKLIKQPLIPAYIFAGVLVGPYFLKLVTNASEINVLAELGIAFLLFIVGLEIDIKKLKEVGVVAIFGGLMSVAAVFGIGLLASKLMGYGIVEGAYIGMIIAFSSTLIVVKLLSDHKELGTLHGRIILGMLLLQDIIAIFSLFFFSTGNMSLYPFLITVVKGLGLFFIAFLMQKFVLGDLFKFSARHRELLFLSSISVCFIFALMAYSLGFSIVVGAFVAGLSLASLPYNFEIAGKIKPLRDFFSILFFVSLGMQLVVGDLGKIAVPLIVFILIIVALKPFITTIIVRLFGYERKTSFLSGFYMAQISEFSLILVSKGLASGQVSNEIFSITIIAAILTMTLTPYFVEGANSIYQPLSGLFRFTDFLPKSKEKLEYRTKEREYDVVLFGCHRMGSILLEGLRRSKRKVLAVDYDPDVIKHLIKERIECMYGDVASEDILDKINFRKTKVVILTVPGMNDSLGLMEYVKSKNKHVIVILTASNRLDAINLYEMGADYVIIPRLLSGQSVSHMLNEIFGRHKTIHQIKEYHLKYVLDAKIMGER